MATFYSNKAELNPATGLPIRQARFHYEAAVGVVATFTGTTAGGDFLNLCYVPARATILDAWITTTVAQGSGTTGVELINDQEASPDVKLTLISPALLGTAGLFIAPAARGYIVPTVYSVSDDAAGTGVGNVTPLLVRARFTTAGVTGATINFGIVYDAGNRIDSDY
jgi:hypothetical protein